MARNQFAGSAATTAVAGIVGPTDASFTVTNATGYPDASVGPFVVTLDLGRAGLEEKILVGARTGNVMSSLTRGYDGTVAVQHTNPTVDHTLAAVQVDEANAHTNVTTRDDHTQYYNQSRHDAHSHSGVPGVVGSVTAGSTKIVVGGTPAAPTVDLGTVPESAITNLVSDLAAKVTGVTAGSAKIVIGGTATAPTVDVGTGIPESAITNLVSDLAGKAPASGIAESAVTNLVSDLAAKAPTASPTFTGAFAHSGTTFGINGNTPVAKASAIAAPATQTASYVQADVQSIVTAVNAIRAALAAVGITA